MKITCSPSLCLAAPFALAGGLPEIPRKRMDECVRPAEEKSSTSMASPSRHLKVDDECYEIYGWELDKSGVQHKVEVYFDAKTGSIAEKELDLAGALGTDLFACSTGVCLGGIAPELLAAEGGEAPHRWLGYALCALVLVRSCGALSVPTMPVFAVSWSVHGVSSPPCRILRRITASTLVGHSPLAGWMILLLLALVVSRASPAGCTSRCLLGSDCGRPPRDPRQRADRRGGGACPGGVVGSSGAGRLPLLRSMLWRGFD